MKILFKAILNTTFAALLTINATAATAANYSVDLGSNVQLTDANGTAVSGDDMKGTLSLVYFGYTKCLMQCPSIWISFEQLNALLGANADKVRLYFISIDPARDTVEQLAQWQQDWPSITALTGDSQQIRNAADAFHIFYARKPKHAMPAAMSVMKQLKQDHGGDSRVKWNPKKSGDDYMMDHTNRSFLLGKNGDYITHFELEHSADEIADYIKDYLQR